MKKIKSFLVFLFLISFAFVGAQEVKFNRGFAKKISSSPSNEKIHVLVKGDLDVIRAEVKSSGGIFKTSAGNIASVEISLSAASKLIQNKKIERIEFNSEPDVPLMDTLWSIKNNIDSVHNGLGTLTQSYTGKGVVVGFIDTGFDYRHSDFNDSLGGSRILFAWDQVATVGTPPASFAYGVEWDKTQIESGVAVNQPNIGGPTGGGFHGQTVATIGVGDGDTCMSHTGAAPKADIIFVVADFSKSTYAEDATAYIYAKALALGKPCVINASLGSQFGTHDASDLRSQMIEALLDAEKGRSFVTACGNNGTKFTHVGYDVTSDSSFTWMKKVGAGSIYGGMFGSVADITNIQFALGVDDTNSFEFRGRTPLFNVGTATLGVLMTDSIMSLSSPGSRIAKYDYFFDLYNGVYSLDFIVTTLDSAAYYVRMITQGSGHIDAWSNNWVANTALPSVATYSEMSRYKATDSLQSVFSSFQCSPKVITVGVYNNRNCYTAFDGIEYCDNSFVEGSFKNTSSRGPTRTGLTKPDITSAGAMFMTGCYTSVLATLGAPSKAVCGIHRFTGNSGSTSYATPAVTGAVACFLEKYPNATWQEIKTAVTLCATVDAFTTSSVPNNLWGHGKLNAYQAITTCGPTAIRELEYSNSILQSSPNPFCNETEISYSFPESFNAQEAEILIYNVVGTKIASYSLKEKSGKIIFSGKNLSSGIYFCQLKNKGAILETRKIILTR